MLTKLELTAIRTRLAFSGAPRSLFIRDDSNSWAAISDPDVYYEAGDEYIYSYPQVHTDIVALFAEVERLRGDLDHSEACRCERPDMCDCAGCVLSRTDTKEPVDV